MFFRIFAQIVLISGLIAFCNASPEEAATSININAASATSMNAASATRYVVMPKPASPRKVSLAMQGAKSLQGELRVIGGNMKGWIERMSRNKVRIAFTVGLERRAKGHDVMRLVLIPGAHSVVPIIGNGASAKHELMHQFGMGHANVRLWDTQTTTGKEEKNRDPFDVLTLTPDKPSLNAPHLHMLGWFAAKEEAYAENGGEYELDLINSNHDDSTLKALFYTVPRSKRQYWFSYVSVSNSKGWQAPEGMPETAVAVHSADEGAYGATYFEGFIGLDARTHLRTGLILELSNPTSRSVKVKVRMDPKWKLVE